MNKLERKPKGGKKAAAAAKLAASDEIDKKGKEQALERMLKEVWSVEGQKVRLAAVGDEVLSDEQLEQRASSLSLLLSPTSSSLRRRR